MNHQKNTDISSSDANAIENKIHIAKLTRKLILLNRKSEFYANLYTRKTMAYFISIIGLAFTMLISSIYRPNYIINLCTIWISGASVFNSILGIINTIDKKNYNHHLLNLKADAPINKDDTPINKNSSYQ